MLLLENNQRQGTLTGMHLQPLLLSSICFLGMGMSLAVGAAAEAESSSQTWLTAVLHFSPAENILPDRDWTLV